MLIRDFRELRKNSIPEAGGKGANLGEMTAAGINVPDGFVVTSEAYRTFLRENDLEKIICRELEEAGSDAGKLTEAADRIRDGILSAPIPSRIREAVTNACEAKWPDGGKAVAVRSSATAEDLADASFAGQQETYLNVRGGEEICESIRKCYASLWGHRAVIYRQNSGYNSAEVALAAVVQEMVESETAGVLFTVNPVNGNPDEIKINASYGLGESVVSGRVTPDEYVCSREGAVLRRVRGTKETEIVYNGEGTGTCTKKVSRERRERDALSEREIAALVRQGLMIEKHYGRPMDVEWAMINGMICILQARAITTLKADETGILPTEEEMEEARTAASVFRGVSLENMVFLLEKMPFVYTHLDNDFGDIPGHIKNEIFSDIGLEIDGDTHLDENGIQSLPNGKKRVTGRIFHLFSLLRQFRNSSWILKEIQSGEEEGKKLLTEAEKTDTNRLSFRECLEELEKLREDIRRICRVRFMYAFVPAYLQGKKAEKAVTRANPAWSSAEMTLDLDYRTALITRDQEAMARQLSADPLFVEDALTGMSYQQAVEKYPTLRTVMGAFLKKHGYKSDYNCYCMHARTWNEDPARLYQVMLPQLRAAREGAVSKPEMTIEEVRAGVRKTMSEKAYKDFLVNLEIYRQCHVLREESQYCWEGLFEMVRRVTARMGSLVSGRLENPSDLQYLSLDELKQIRVEDGKVEIPEELMGRILNRASHHPEAVRKWNAARKALLERAAASRNKGSAGDAKHILLSGVGGSAGTAEGPVTIVRNPGEFGKFHKGDVLVCPYTDPEWTALFSLASAVVADTGGTLSHAAIVAREYGIPAVLGVGFGTEKLHDGDRILVNGDQGTVSET